MSSYSQPIYFSPQSSAFTTNLNGEGVHASVIAPPNFYLNPSNGFGGGFFPDWLRGQRVARVMHPEDRERNVALLMNPEKITNKEALQIDLTPDQAIRLDLYVTYRLEKAASEERQRNDKELAKLSKNIRDLDIKLQGEIAQRKKISGILWRRIMPDSSQTKSESDIANFNVQDFAC